MAKVITAPKMTADGVVQALKNDLIRDEYFPGGLFYVELEAPSANRRVDALWVEKFTGKTVGYEIKVSRQDLIHELRQPDKCDPWKRFCDQWWLVVGDPSIIAGMEDEIPADWGICTPPTASNRRMMTVLRPAPKLTPVDKTPLLGKLAGVVGRDIADAQMKKLNSESHERGLLDQLQKLRNELHQAGITEQGANESEVVRRALSIANENLGHRSIYRTYGLRNEEMLDTEAQKLAEFFTHVHIAKMIDEDILKAAQDRAEALENVMRTAVEPLRKHWRTGSILKQVDEIIAKRPANEGTLFEVQP